MNNNRFLGICFIAMGFIAFKPVYEQSSIPHVENLLACGAMTILFCILFLPMAVKFRFLKKFNWTCAMSAEQIKAFENVDIKMFRENGAGYLLRVKPFAMRLVLLIVGLGLIQSIFFPDPPQMINIFSYINIALLSVMFYLTAVICVICITIYLSLNRSKK